MPPPITATMAAATGGDGETVHVEGPPDGPSERPPHLRRRLGGLEDGGDHAIGRLVGSQLEPGSGESVEVTFAWSCHPSFGDDRRRVGLDGRAQRPGSRSGVASGPCRPGCRGSRRSRSAAGPTWWCRTKTARCSTVRRRNARSSASRSMTESRRIRGRRSVDRQDTDVRRPRAPTPGLGVARMDEQAPDPGFEAIRVTQGRELAPDGDEGTLQGVLGEDRVAQDPRRRARTSGRWSCGPAPRMHRDRPPGPLDEISHRHSLDDRAGWPDHHQ